MCGIAGIIRPRGVDVQALVTMTRMVAHRGPDGEGFWFWNGVAATGHVVQRPTYGGGQFQVGLGHRRLAILDTSAAGAQPMATADGQCVLTYNGEIVNYLEVRRTLEGLGERFHTGTDTEVMLKAYAVWGRGCFPMLNGMWAFGLVDLRTRQLLLCRDRFGIKPLYVYAEGGQLAFASEIKQFLALPGFRPVVNQAALAEYLDTGYEMPPQTFFQGVYAFPPGCYAAIDLDKPHATLPQPYWEPATTTRRTSRFEAMARTRESLSEAVRLHLRSDVPVGVSFSGGLDSSAILALAAKHQAGMPPPIQAFSAGFHDPAYDEGAYRGPLLDALGWERAHLTLPRAEQFLEDCDTWLWHHDEPPGSLSQYAAWTVMRLARQAQVPVLLNGQGGDELFSGYWPAYYLWLRQQARRAPWRVVSHALGAALPGGNPHLLRQAQAHWQQYQHRQARDQHSLLAGVGSHAAPDWRQHVPEARGAHYPQDRPGSDWAQEAQGLDPAQYRLAELRHVHLPRLLKWDDRNSMAFGIEGRYPLLEHGLVDWALTLPPGRNLRRGWNKWVLRQALTDLLPPAIVWRQDKVGFVTPQVDWMRGPLHRRLWTWVAAPSERLQTVLRPHTLHRLAVDVLHTPTLGAQDERQLLLMRCYLLDRWMTRFDVDLPSS